MITTKNNIFSPKKKSKQNGGDTFNKKSKNTLENDLGLSNPAFNPLCTPLKIQKHILTTIEETVSEEDSILEETSPKTMETEAEVYEKVSLSMEQISEENCNGELSYEMSKKRKKKRLTNLEPNEMSNPKDKAFKNKDITTLDLENAIDVESPCEIECQENKKKKKKKNVVCFDNPNFEEPAQEAIDSSQIKENPYEIQVKNRGRKNKKNENNVDNGSREHADILDTIEHPCKVKSTKKKKKEKMALENPSFNLSTEDSTEVSQNEEISHEIKNKRKKKRKLTLEDPSFNEPVENVTSSQSYENLHKGKKKKTLAFENCAYNDSVEQSTDFIQTTENPYEVRVGEKKKKKKHLAIDNPAFNDVADVSVDFSQVEENPFEVGTKQSKKKKKKMFAIDNPHFDPNNSLEESVLNNELEQERKKKKSKRNDVENGVNPALNLDTSSQIKENVSIDIEANDLMLNIVTIPLVSKSNTTNLEIAHSIPQTNSIKRSKSVRFSDVTEERIIPNNNNLRNSSDIENRNELFDINTQVLNNSLQSQSSFPGVTPADAVFSYNDANKGKKGNKRNLGLDNVAFDKQNNHLDENIDSISKTLDRYQSEIENDINEKKLEEFSMENIMVGEVGNPHGENEKLAKGTKLKFKYAQFMTKTPSYYRDITGPKKSYKHLIKGDIVIKFNNTNLHEISGYAVKSRSTAV